MSDPSEMEMRTASAGDVEHAQVILIADRIRAATADFVTGSPEPHNAMVLVMTAASLFGGTLFGTLITMGVAKDQDRRRAVDAMAKNFRSGIDIGKNRALRVAAEEFGGHA